MSGYYVVNNVAQANGDHEVHVLGCSYFPTNYSSLGHHASCRTAVALARQQFFAQSNGCYYCANPCHTQ